MSRYVVILIMPLVVGCLIAVAILLLNGLRERRERKDMELREARLECSPFRLLTAGT